MTRRFRAWLRLRYIIAVFLISGILAPQAASVSAQHLLTAVGMTLQRGRSANVVMENRNERSSD